MQNRDAFSGYPPLVNFLFLALVLGGYDDFHASCEPLHFIGWSIGL